MFAGSGVYELAGHARFDCSGPGITRLETAGDALPLTQIVQNAGGVLVAQQSPQTGAWFLNIALVLAAGFALLFWKRHQRQRAKFARTALYWLFLLRLLTPLYKTCQIRIDHNAHEISWTATRFGQQVSAESMPSSDIAAADLESSRGDRRIVVIRRDGTPVYPLGDMYLTGQTNQYVILTAIREMIERASDLNQRKPM